VSNLYTSPNVCLPCIEGCIKCDNSLVCVDCQENSYYKNDASRCVRCADTNCLTCSKDTCVECAKGFIRNNEGTCISCPENCSWDKK